VERGILSPALLSVAASAAHRALAKWAASVWEARASFRSNFSMFSITSSASARLAAFSHSLVYLRSGPPLVRLWTIEGRCRIVGRGLCYWPVRPFGRSVLRPTAVRPVEDVTTCCPFTFEPQCNITLLQRAVRGPRYYEKRPMR
jgi:hypothetical protein